MSSNLVVNTEEFIVEIQSRPAIWDFREESYCNSNEKNQAWEEICKKFIKGFKRISETEKSAYRTELRKKWKNVRDCYTRELNKQKTETHRPGRKKYMHADLLSFLTPVCVLTQNKPFSFPENNDDFLDNADRNRGANMQNSKENQSKKIKLTPEEENSSTTEDSTLFKELSGTIRYLSKLQQENDDPDKQFLMSLLHDFKEIPQTLKFDAKFEIMSVIHKYSRLQDFPQYNTTLESSSNYEYSDVNKLSPIQSPSTSKCDPLDS